MPPNEACFLLLLLLLVLSRVRVGPLENGRSRHALAVAEFWIKRQGAMKPAGKTQRRFRRVRWGRAARWLRLKQKPFDSIDGPFELVC